MNSGVREISGENYRSQVQQMKPFNWLMNTSNLQMPFEYSSLFLQDHTSSLSSSSASSSSSNSSPSHFHPNYFNPSSQLQYLPAYSYLHEHERQEPTEAWNQSIFLGGAIVGESGRCCSSDQYLEQKKVENSFDPAEMFSSVAPFDVKQEMAASNVGHPNFHQQDISNSSWSEAHHLPAFTANSLMSSSDGSFLMSNSSNKRFGKTQNQDHSPKNPNTCAISSAKKARLQPTNFKVRKEKVGDRIAALHQLVSPFGKTDTASVLAEATGYIRFLQSQIEALSSPYLGRSSSNCSRRPGSERGGDEPRTSYSKDLRSRGLCLVPLSCTSLQVSNDIGQADQFWASTFGPGFQ